MNDEFRLFPEQASTIAPRVDLLYAYLVAVSGFFVVLICALILYFGIKYRRGSRATRATHPVSYKLEVVWCVIPFILVMTMFGWGAVLYVQMYEPPRDGLVIHVFGKQWMWKAQHPNGRREINQLHVPVGQTVLLRMISDDVIHSFYVPAFRVKMDVLPDRYHVLWFNATRAGRYHLFCAEYCGTGHSEMVGEVIVMTQAEYSAWLAEVPDEPPEVVGRRLFEQYGCGGCHPPGEGTRGPSLVELFGRQRVLETGQRVTADETYIRESILYPRRKVVAGFEPIMPTFADQLDEEQVAALIAYLKTLSVDERGGSSGE